VIKVLRGLGLIVPMLIVGVAHGATINFVAPLGLTGAQEVPVRATPATGTGAAEYDDLTLLLTVHLAWSDLLAPAVAAHIHCCPGPGVNGPVAIDFVPAGFPNVTSGVFDHVFDLDDAASYGGGFLALFGGNVDAARDAVIAGLTDGLAYFNIHTAVFPGGEIRGDIVQVVPGPAALLLLALGLSVLAATRRLE
jgi:CHRD domain-containing protein